MTVVFRVDASPEIGAGHLMRCLVLAQALRGRGIESHFVCYALDSRLVQRILEAGHHYSGLPLVEACDHDVSSENPPELAAWLQAPWHIDASETIERIKTNSVDWLIVDHYGIDFRWESFLRDHVKKLMVIDDLADRRHACDLLLDQNLVDNQDERYQGLIPSNCTNLLGPHYALLQPQYGELHHCAAPRRPPIKRVLISFGGWDQHNLTSIALRALIKLSRDDLLVDVVLSGENAFAEEVHSLADALGNVVVHQMLPSLSELMLQADLAIGAGGSTSWERLCLGLPTIVISSADNQIETCRELAKRGLIDWAGHFDSIGEGALFGALKAALNNDRHESVSRDCLKVTDGLGADRVSEILALTVNTTLRIRPARLSDEDLLLEWRNDAGVRSRSFQSNLVSPDDHRKWFLARLADQTSRIYIVETESGLEIGQVRFEFEADGWEVHYSIASFARGMGLGERVLGAAIQYHLSIFPEACVFGKVLTGNPASQRIFKKLGFQEYKYPKHTVFKLQTG